jgi:hypothetical protein
MYIKKKKKDVIISIFQDIMVSSLLKVNQYFRGTYPLLPLLAACFMLVSCLVYSSNLKMGATCSSKSLVDFQ